MPVLDGYSATKELKKLISANTLPSLKIIGCSALVTNKEKKLSSLSGMDFIHEKPLKRTEIESLLNF